MKMQFTLVVLVKKLFSTNWKHKDLIGFQLKTKRFNLSLIEN